MLPVHSRPGDEDSGAHFVAARTMELEGERPF